MQKERGIISFPAYRSYDTDPRIYNILLYRTVEKSLQENNWVQRSSFLRSVFAITDYWLSKKK